MNRSLWDNLHNLWIITFESSWLNSENWLAVKWLLFYIYNGAVLYCRHIPMTFQPKTIQKSNLPHPKQLKTVNRSRSTDPGPQIPVQDIKYILYQLIFYLQFHGYGLLTVDQLNRKNVKILKSQYFYSIFFTFQW